MRLTLKDGTCIDILAVVCNEQIAIEDIRCNPPLFLDSFDTIAARVAAPLKDAYQALSGQRLQQPEEEHARWDASDMRREWFENVPARQGIRPRGRLARLITAEAYQRARQEGRDPILAVMCATGRSRRRSLRLIAHARDDGYLSPRHNRR